MLFHRLWQLLWLLMLLHVGFTWWSAARRGRRARRETALQPAELPQDLPPVSVIIPAWNESGTIERNIRALRAIEYPIWEVIILAGGNDGTYDVACRAAADDARIRVLERVPDPKNAALSRGVHVARYDILVFLDADSIVETGWLPALVTPLLRGAAASVGDRLPEKPGWVTAREDLFNAYSYQVLQTPVFQGDRSIAIHRAALDLVGGLPVHTYAREDWDLWLRLTAAKQPIAFAPGARVVSARPVTLREYWRDQVRWRRTLLSGLWEHRAYFLTQARRLAFANLYLYLVSAGLVAAVLLALVTAWSQPAAAAFIGKLLASFLLWFLLRLPAVAIAMAAFTGAKVSLRRWWAPVLTAVVEIPASIVAMLSFGKQTPFYKGVRHNGANLCTE